MLDIPLSAATHSLSWQMPTDLQTAIDHFRLRVSNLEISPIRRFRIGELQSRKSSAYTGWGSAPGIYFFEQAGRVQYIGRALPGTGLRSRVHNQCTAFDDPHWDEVIKDPETSVGVITVPPEEWYWTAALEPYLIEVFAPPHNRKAC